MKKFNWNWVVVPAALLSLAAGLFYVFSGNVVAFGCCSALFVFAVVFTVFLEKRAYDEQVYGELGEWLKPNDRLGDIAQKAIDIGKELQKDNLGLVKDLEELNKVVEVMSSYLTSSVHETINKKIYETGYEFVWDEDEGKYRLFTNRARRKE